jgi:ADP-heptose:LPS heptosyltransferase
MGFELCGRWISSIAIWDNRISMSISRSAEALAGDFLRHYFASGEYLGGHINELTRMAISADRRRAVAASRAIFERLVEPLADSFEPSHVTLYNRCFAQVIQTCRSLDPELDRELARFGLAREADLLGRAERLRSIRAATVEDPALIMVLSRITIGADVAITSVIIERLKRRFPTSDILLIGGDKLAELFGGDARLKFCKIGYDRAGTLPDRLRAWLGLLNLVRELTCGLSPDQFLVIDPDSRLTQLGLLPLVSDENYLFFPSREYGGESDLPLGRLTSDWLNQALGEEATTLPRINLRSEDSELAAEVIARLKRAGTTHIVAINFGVGQDPTKRISDDFERRVVASLLCEGATVILDKGAGGEESVRAEAIASSLRSLSGEKICPVECGPENLFELLARESIASKLIIWRGRIGSLAGLISKSDLYIGYDSAGQHIAAALGTPCIDIFPGNRPQRFLQRWRPVGPAPVEVIEPERGIEGLIDRIALSARRALKMSHLPWKT